MGSETPPSRDVLLAIALGSQRQGERRAVPDHRSGIDRRKSSLPVVQERRSGTERRRAVRRQSDREEGPTLLDKARTRMRVRLRIRRGKGGGGGLR